MNVPSPEERVAALVHLLEVERIDEDQFRGRRKEDWIGRIFGGQVIAQALAAAEQTAPAGRAPHSLHAYFLRGGSEDHPIDFHVERDFDGGSFSNRRVVASQLGRPILNLAASFHKAEDGAHHQIDMGLYPEPEGLATDRDMAEKIRQKTGKLPHFLRPGSIEMRLDLAAAREGDGVDRTRSFTWIRTVAALPDDPAIHRVVIAYLSDMTLLSTSLKPHRLSFAKGNIRAASLDHALWFHEPARADEWLLYTTDTPWTGHARGFNRGLIYTQEGRLVASVTQEGLIRVVEDTAQPDG